MKVSTKRYKCPVCGEESLESTNHYGEIYSGCGKCGHSVLYCNEPEALKMYESRNKVKAKVYTYYFFLDEDQEDFEEKLVEYEGIKNKLSKQGFKCFEVLSKPLMKSENDFIGDGDEVVVYDPETFEDQYITNRGRLHRWSEKIYPNKKVKEGYYLIFEGEENE